MPETQEGGLNIRSLLTQIEMMTAYEHPPEPIDLKRAPLITTNVYYHSEWSLPPLSTGDKDEPEKSKISAYRGCQLLGLPRFYYEELIGKKPEEMDEFDKFVCSAGDRYKRVSDKTRPLREQLAILIAAKKENVDPQNIVKRYAEILGEALIKQIARYKETIEKMVRLPLSEFVAEYGRDAYFYMNPGQSYSESVDLKRAAPHMLNEIWISIYNLHQLLNRKQLFFDSVSLNPPMGSRSSPENEALIRLPTEITQPVIQKVQEAAQNHLGRKLSLAPYPQVARAQGECTLNSIEETLLGREAAARVFCAIDALDPKIPIVGEKRYQDVLYGSDAQPGLNRVVQSMKIGLEKSGQFYLNITNYKELIKVIISLYPEKWEQLSKIGVKGMGGQPLSYVWPHGIIETAPADDIKTCRERFERSKDSILERIQTFVSSQNIQEYPYSHEYEEILEEIKKITQVLSS